MTTDAEKAAAYAKTVAGDAVKVLPTVVADVTKAKAEVIAVDTKLTAWIKNNAGKIAIGVLVAAGLLVWHLI